MNMLLIANNFIIRMLRRKIEFIVLTLLPIIIVGLMTIISNTGTDEKIRIGYLNMDEGIYGSYLIDDLNGVFEIREMSEDKYDAVIYIPESFSADIMKNISLVIKMEFEEGSINANKALVHINSSIDRLYKYKYRKTEEQIFTVKDEAVEDYGREMTSIGFIIVFMMLLMLISSGTILEDKKRLLLARIFTKPVKTSEIVLGNLMGNMAVGMLQLIPILLIIKMIFGLPFGNVFAGISLTFFAFLIAAVGFGIGITGILKSNFNPMLLMAVVIVPSSILAGAFIPSSMLPDIVNRIAFTVPQKWVMVTVVTLLKTGDLSKVLINIVIIMLFGAVFLTFGIKTLKPSDI